ncbi:MAG TPA: tetratricopeptide repeat protein, partial [Candidatus Synoicihabitans sp.]|nr:tetratricopeptide repeat protein [Candidatus Synoicihabitans sp.]
PKDELVFYARFKQADLLRKLNQFGPAVQIYEQLTNTYPQHPDVLAAELAKADCYAAQAAADVSQLESALSIYERLFVVPSAPRPLRIEAGFKRGQALQRRGSVERAQSAWWEVVNTFLLEREPRSTLDAKARFWLARSLFELARSFEGAARLNEARNAYELIVQQDLLGAQAARAALARLGIVTPEGGR